MSARIIDGKACAARLNADLRERVAARVAQGKPQPGLAVVLVGENAASQVYVRNKRRTTDAAGMRSFSHDLPADDVASRAAGADRPAERGSRRARHPGAVAAAEAHRRRSA